MPKKRKIGFLRYRGFSLVELLIVVFIIGILAAFLIPNASALLNRAQAPLCASRLRNLWTVFSGVLNDGNPWPQLPTNIVIGSVEEQHWWLEYGSNSLQLTAKDWNCPTVTRMLSNSSNSVAEAHLISYLPMLFDNSPSTPTRWPSAPWFMEIANVHGNGVQMVRADGSVVTAPTAAPNSAPNP